MSKQNGSSVLLREVAIDTRYRAITVPDPGLPKKRELKARFRIRAITVPDPGYPKKRELKAGFRICAITVPDRGFSKKRESKAGFRIRAREYEIRGGFLKDNNRAPETKTYPTTERGKMLTSRHAKLTEGLMASENAKENISKLTR